MFLLDTNVVSELRRIRPHGSVLAWLRATPEEHLHIAAVTIGELQAGVEVTRDQDPDKATQIESWIDNIAATYNIVPLDASIFRRWARLMHRVGRQYSEDAMIAATAEVRNLTVVTRNVRDFKHFGVAIFNPFS